MKVSNQQAMVFHETTSTKPWWNRPLWGEHTLLEKISAHFLKEPVPESSVVIHDQALQELTQLSASIEGFNHPIFKNSEFIFLLKLRASFLHDLPGYQNLEESSQILKSAIEAKDSFLKIEETEFQFRSSVQQKFYEDVVVLLAKNLSKEAFKTEIDEMEEITISKLKTEEGITAIKSYSKELNRLSLKHRLGLRLLYLFKKSELADFSVLRQISQLVNRSQQENLKSYSPLLAEVKRHADVFEKVGKIIGVTGEQNRPETYAKILQYIALMDKYKDSYSEFEQLLSQLNNWDKSYRSLKALREKYPAKGYKQPKTFRQNLSGFALYQKYQPWLFLSPENLRRGV